MLRFFILTIFFGTVIQALHASVEHKDEFIEVYLSNISKNMDEKTQLLEYILRNPDGRFIDIGTGGDSIAIMASNLPKNSCPTLIAADIDPLVINSIKKRHPEIAQFINSNTGPKVELLTTSATDLSCLSDSSILGISASAIAHEVYSYTPSRGALDMFIGEACRVLEKNGVFIYRDPKWIDDPETRCTLTLKNEVSKYYASLFLTKFLDRKFSLIRDYRGECCKPEMYFPTDVKITAFIKNIQKNMQLSFEEFLETPTSKIDYSEPFSIEAPKGLLAELQRHYLMYLKNYFPIGLINCNVDDDCVNLSNISQEERGLIENYAAKHNILVNNDQIGSEQMDLMFNELKILRKIFSDGFQSSLENQNELRTYASILMRDGMDENLFHLAKNKFLTIDPKILTLLFEGKDKSLFRYLRKDQVPFDLLEHLKLEGEEHYFYKTTDEIITYFGQYSNYILKDGPKHRYCLAPIDPEHVKEVSRDLYGLILDRDMPLMDEYGVVQKPVTSKNIIHFKLQPEREAFATYKKLIALYPSKFPKLKKWVNMGSHEILDLVSDDDEVIGAMTRNEIYSKNIHNFRVVNAFLINSKGEVWVPTRHPSKQLFPLSLDCSIGGHVMSNENYFEALVREGKEEINIDVSKLPYKLIEKLTPNTHGTSAFMEVFAINYDGPVNFNPDDFVKGEWMTWKQLKKLLKEGHLAKSDLEILVDRMFCNE